MSHPSINPTHLDRWQAEQLRDLISYALWLTLGAFVLLGLVLCWGSYCANRDERAQRPTRPPRSHVTVIHQSEGEQE